MPSGNTVHLWGHLGKDPEIKKTTTDKTILTFSIANKRGEQTDWFDVTRWEPSEFDLKLKKGDLVLIQGKMIQDKWEKDGIKRTAIKVNAYRIDRMKAKEGEQVPLDLPHTESSDLPDCLK